MAILRPSVAINIPVLALLEPGSDVPVVADLTRSGGCRPRFPCRFRASSRPLARLSIRGVDGADPSPEFRLSGSHRRSDCLSPTRRSGPVGSRTTCRRDCQHQFGDLVRRELRIAAG